MVFPFRIRKFLEIVVSAIDENPRKPSIGKKHAGKTFLRVLL